MSDASVMATVSIRCNATGEVRKVEMLVPADEGVPTEYAWEAGNYSCDCNRELFFTGIPDTEAVKCGNDRYAVEIEHNGNVVYSEFEESANG